MSIITNHLLNNVDIGSLLQPNFKLYTYNNSSQTVNIGTPTNVGSFTFIGSSGYYNINLSTCMASSDSNHQSYSFWINLTTTTANIDTSSDMFATTVTDGSIPCLYSSGPTCSGPAPTDTFAYPCIYTNYVKFLTGLSGYSNDNIWSGGNFVAYLTNNQTYYINCLKTQGHTAIAGYIKTIITGPIIINSPIVL